MRDVKTLAVLGAGDMGHGVTELAALKGFEVRLRDLEPGILEKAMGQIRASLDKLVAKSRLTREQADAALGRIRPFTDLQEALAGVDLVVEAVPERVDLKQRVFVEVERLAPAHAVLATNTSAIRIQEIAAPLRDPGRLVGMHFFNPVLLMDLVEIIPGPATRPEVVATVQEVARRLGRTQVTLGADTPGFVTSRLISVWVGAAVLCHDHKLGTREEIDAALRYKAGFPMGPFELADYTGLDVGAHASSYLAARLGPAYAPGASLISLVEKGLLGKKSGRGFYEWREGRIATPITPDLAGRFDPAQVMALVANEAAKLLEQGVASAADIDLAMRQGCAFPKGPLEWADEVGAAHVLKTLLTLEEKTGHPLAKPYELLIEKVESPAAFHAQAPSAPRAPEAVDAAAAPSPPAPYETVLVEVDAATHVGVVILNRPHRLHTLNAQLFRELRDALRAMERDERVRVVMLTGKGEAAFCAGADLSDTGDMTPAKGAQLAREGHLLCLEIEKMGKPVVAALNGHALGGGLELALPCDFRVAARRAQLALPEVTLGLLPAMGGTQRLPRLVGLARAKEIALFGNRMDAQTALRVGLVHAVYENDSFEPEARAFCAQLAQRAPLSLRFTKQLLNAAPTTDLLSGMEAEAAAFGVLLSTEDMMEGVASLFARKKPEFQGR